MGARERILTIRLMEKLQARPAYAKVLGIEIYVARSTDATDKEK